MKLIINKERTVNATIKRLGKVSEDTKREGKYTFYVSLDRMIPGGRDFLYVKSGTKEEMEKEHDRIAQALAFNDHTIHITTNGKTKEKSKLIPKKSEFVLTPPTPKAPKKAEVTKKEPEFSIQEILDKELTKAYQSGYRAGRKKGEGDIMKKLKDLLKI